jgi:hypothetical protein
VSEELQIRALAGWREGACRTATGVLAQGFPATPAYSVTQVSAGTVTHVACRLSASPVSPVGVVNWFQRGSFPTAGIELFEFESISDLRTSANCTACLCCSPIEWTLHDATTLSKASALWGLGLRRGTTSPQHGMVWCPSYPLDRNRCDQVVAAGSGAS